MITSFVCYGAIVMKNKLGYDNRHDAFGVHGVAATTWARYLYHYIAKLMARSRQKVCGWNAIDQLGVQIKAVGIAIGYTAIVGFAFVTILVDKLFGLRATATRKPRVWIRPSMENMATTCCSLMRPDALVNL